MKTVLATDKAPSAIGPYSQGIAAGSLVITSGQLPVDPATGAFALADIADLAAMNEAYAAFFPSDPPARSAVEVARLPKDARIEIEVIAVK